MAGWRDFRVYLTPESKWQHRPPARSAIALGYPVLVALSSQVSPPSWSSVLLSVLLLALRESSLVAPSSSSAVVRALRLRLQLRRYGMWAWITLCARVWRGPENAADSSTLRSQAPCQRSLVGSAQACCHAVTLELLAKAPRAASSHGSARLTDSQSMTRPLWQLPR